MRNTGTRSASHAVRRGCPCLAEYGPAILPPARTTGEPPEHVSNRACSRRRPRFDNVYVPAEAILAGVGAGSTIFTTAMDWERICLGATHIGTMERLLEETITYARTRTQFGQSIGKFQAIGHRVADMKVQLEAARLLAYRSAWRLDRVRSVSMDASMTKLLVSESLMNAALAAVQVHGGYGFMTEYEVERALRDAVASTIYSGTSEMQRNIIARWLGL